MALVAQGLGRPRPEGRTDIRHVRRVFRDVHVVQIDSVNVLVRSHRLPLFSRLGAYPIELLDDATYRRHELFEYWAHEASLVPVEDHPLFGWVMDGFREGRYWPRLARFAEDNGPYIDAVEQEVRDRGPLSAGELSDPGERTGPWWGWADGKTAMEWLFAAGRVTVSERRGFERVYDLTERVLPAEVLDAPTPTKATAVRELTFRAIDALGVATAPEIGDYHRIKTATIQPHIDAAVRDGDLLEVEVQGWGRRTAYARPDRSVPRAVDARALLCPFDSLIWHRDRTERLFDFRYRLEIYTPAADREYGYYVLPFLLGETLVARFDLKADRDGGRLLVRGAYREPGTDGVAVAEAAAAELVEMTEWLGLDEIRVGRRGDLAAALRRAL